MSNEMTQKIRLVKCPRCRKLLPEPPGVPLYSCGGCGTILRAKFEVRDDQKKKQQHCASPNGESSRTSNYEVKIPSPAEHSPNLRSHEGKDMSRSCSTRHEGSERTCSSTELSSPITDPNSDPMVSNEASAKVCPPTVLAARGNQESSPTLATNLDGNVSEENSEFVLVQSEAQKIDRSGKRLETVGRIMPMDRDSTIQTESCANGSLQTSGKSAAAEYLESIPTPSHITSKLSDDHQVEDQSSDMDENATKHVYKEATAAVSRENLSKERFVQQKPSTGRDSFPIYRTMDSKSISSAPYVEKSLREGPGMVRGGHPTRFATGSYGDELPIHGWGPQVTSHGSEEPSNRMIRNASYSSTSYGGERSENIIPQDKEELMRMVVELENQLNRMHSVEEESPTGSNFNSYQQSNYQFNHSYFPERYGPASTYSSSPRPQVYSNLLWDSKTVSDDQMDEFLGLKNLREKTHFPKRHCRPIAGASPMLTCYSCTELLQIPEDFLLSRRKRCHWLKCGACSTVLRFSLQDGTHIAPSPPELDSHDHSIHRKNWEDIHPTDNGYPLQVKTGGYPSTSYGSSEDFNRGIEDDRGRKGSSALHQLMGYSSVSQVLS